MNENVCFVHLLLLLLGLFPSTFLAKEKAPLLFLQRRSSLFLQVVFSLERIRYCVAFSEIVIGLLPNVFVESKRKREP
jgi:hypothetical protein